MRAIILLLMLAGCFVSCKKKDNVNPNLYPCSTGNCNVRPVIFYYVVADNQGQSLLPPGSDGVNVSYSDKGQNVNSGIAYPVPTYPGSATALVVNGSSMGELSEGGIKTFYLTFRGKTDTLGLDIHSVTPATVDNSGHSTPVVTFNGRPMQPVVSDPTYFVLKRR